MNLKRFANLKEKKVVKQNNLKVVQDNVVKTTAKLEEEVKSLTAVAGKDGISLLDDNGNLYMINNY